MIVERRSADFSPLVVRVAAKETALTHDGLSESAETPCSTLLTGELPDDPGP